jgi:L-lactate dehydrogenase complex protein LldE
LFVTCLVDCFRPSVGFAAARLIELAGCDVVVPESQTCCGQPAYNSGDRATAAELARQTIKAFADCDYVVVPSGSCAGMIKVHYPDLLKDTPDAKQAKEFADKVFELTAFLTSVRKLDAVPGQYQGKVTYHDSCAGLRELGIKAAPRQLLGLVEGLELNEMTECETCCGFGGLFSVKFPDISNAMVEKKTGHATNTKADLLLAGDLGCLMNMAGKLSRTGSTLECRHVAEVLAGELSAPPIAKGA